MYAFIIYYMFYFIMSSLGYLTSWKSSWKNSGSRSWRVFILCCCFVLKTSWIEKGIPRSNKVIESKSQCWGVSYFLVGFWLEKPMRFYKPSAGCQHQCLFVADEDILWKTLHTLANGHKKLGWDRLGSSSPCCLAFKVRGQWFSTFLVSLIQFLML